MKKTLLLAVVSLVALSSGSFAQSKINYNKLPMEKLKKMCDEKKDGDACAVYSSKVYDKQDKYTKEVVQYELKSVSYGSSMILHSVANHYEYGMKGILKKDLNKSLELYKRSCVEQEDADSCNSASSLLRDTGKKSEAKKYKKLACDYSDNPIVCSEAYE